MPEASVQVAATDGQFEARIEVVRKRFAAKFADRMQQTIADLPGMTGDGVAPADVVANAYHWLHQISGIAATIGFESTGQSARSCDNLLVEPYRAQRGLSAAELAQLTNGLDSLRRAAQAEMQVLK
jgi:HPt (histidine-containing phosphotransfer) domain-containing protein